MSESIVYEVKRLFTDMYGDRWLSDESLPSLDDLQSETWRLTCQVAAGNSLDTNLRKLGLCSLAIQILEVFRSRGPFASIANIELTRLVIGRHTVEEARLWLLNRPHLSNSAPELAALEAIAPCWETPRG